MYVTFYHPCDTVIEQKRTRTMIVDERCLKLEFTSTATRTAVVLVATNTEKAVAACRMCTYRRGAMSHHGEHTFPHMHRTDTSGPPFDDDLDLLGQIHMISTVCTIYCMYVHNVFRVGSI